MPQRARLITRSTSTSTTSAENLNKGSALEFAELDSNLIELRDQTIGIVGDDSSGIDINAGDTLKIAGGTNVTTAVVGDTVTITASASSDVFKTIAVSGQSDVVADANTDTLTLAAGSNMTITTNAGTDTITFASSGGGGSLGDLTAVGSTLIAPSNADLTLAPSGTGNVIIAGGDNKIGDITFADDSGTGHQTISIPSTKTLTISAPSGSINISSNVVSINSTLHVGLGGQDAGGLLIEDNTIKTARSNEPLELAPAGTGPVHVQTSLQLATGTTVTGILDEDAMGSDSAVKLATQQSIRAYVDGKSHTALSGSTNNTITTVTSANNIQGESNLQFDGSTLAVTGALTATGAITTSGDASDISTDTISIDSGSATISGIRSNEDLCLQANGTGLLVLGATGTDFDTYSTATRFNNSTSMFYQDLTHTIANDRVYGNNLISNIKLAAGQDTSNSNDRWRNFHTMIFDMNGSSTTPTSSYLNRGPMAGYFELDILNSSTAGTSRLGNATGVQSCIWINPSANSSISFEASDSSSTNVGACAYSSWIDLDPSSGGTVSIPNVYSYYSNGVAAVGAGTESVTNAYHFYAATNSGTAAITNEYAFYDASPSGQSLFGDVKIKGNTISTNSSNANLELSGNSSGNVNILDGLQIGTSGATVTTILDEDAMGTDSATALASQQSIKAYVDGQTHTGQANEYSFKTISVSGQDNVVADTTTDTLTLAAGSNITITTTAGSDTITIASADTTLSLIDEDDMSTDSATRPPSQQSVKAYADTKAVLTGSTNNTLTTVTGANAFQGEANATFDGSTLAITGNITATTTIAATTDITAGGNISSEGIQLVDNKISASRTNDNIHLQGAGTGDVRIGNALPVDNTPWNTLMGSADRNKGVHIYRSESDIDPEALTSGSDRRMGHVIGQSFKLETGKDGSDSDARFRTATIGVTLDMNGSDSRATGTSRGAMATQAQVGIENTNATASVLGNAISSYNGIYLAPSTGALTVTACHGAFQYIDLDTGGANITVPTIKGYTYQSSSYGGGTASVTTNYGFYVDAMIGTTKYAFYDNTNNLSRFGAVILANQSGDPSGVTDSAHIYAKDDSASSEVYVRDEGGNVTKISPHNEQGDWEFYSKNTKTGKTVRVNMEKMIRKLEEFTGESFIETI